LVIQNNAQIISHNKPLILEPVHKMCKIQIIIFVYRSYNNQCWGFLANPFVYFSVIFNCGFLFKFKSIFDRTSNSTSSLDSCDFFDFQQIVRDTINEIGYTDPNKGYSGDHISVLVGLDKQSPDIALGVDNSLETKQQKEENEVGAGDQGLMFGFATNETPTFMPLPIYLSQKLSKQLAEVRKNGTLSYLGPDGKVQVTIEYDVNHKVNRIDTIVVSTQHDADVSQEQIHADIKKHVIEPCLDKGLLDENTKYFINPTGRFVIGGPVGDAGLTGRKIIVDTYGGFSRHGGGAFSGKDATKVDRSGAYMARYIAKNIVASGICDKAEVQLAYAIGVAHPVSIFVETFGTSKVDEGDIVKTIKEEFRLTPNGIIETLDLRKPIFKKTAAYGHFGREDVEFTWERTDKVEAFKKLLK